MDKLYDQIIETQKTRTQLLKWKLIIAAVLGSIGLGLGPIKDIGSTSLLHAFILTYYVVTFLYEYKSLQSFCEGTFPPVQVLIRNMRILSQK
jgi:hypothetical protein